MKVVGMLMVVVLCMGVCSCAQKKGTIDSDQTDDFEVVPMMNSTDYIQGTVTDAYTKDGCNFLIKYQGKGDEVLINPVNLPKKYQKDGQKINFQWTASRAPQKDDCKLGIWAHITIEE